MCRTTFLVTLELDAYLILKMESLILVDLDLEPGKFNIS